MSTFSKYVRRNPSSSPTDNYRRRQIRRALREHALQGSVPNLEQIAHPENLIQVFKELKANAGQTPGIDGVTYQDLSASEIGICMRGLSKVVLNGFYRPAPSLFVQIPKASGKGHRKLSIRAIMDRVVSAALNKALTPFWDKLFLDGSFGFRPNRGPWDMLLALEKTIIQQNRFVLAIDDIKDCFDHVPLAELMEDHSQHIQDERLLNLNETVLRGGENQTRTKGIQQGDAYSPTAMNVRLHYAHDLGLNQGLNPFWLRYADNTVYPCQDVPEGIQALQFSRALLQPHFTLKGEDPPVDVRDREAQILGFSISFKGQVRYGLGKSAWKGLEDNLDKAHLSPNPPGYALQAVRGWVGAYGPAFESTWSPVEEVLGTAASYGFRELITPKELFEDWQSSWQRWERRRKALFLPSV